MLPSSPLREGKTYGLRGSGGTVTELESPDFPYKAIRRVAKVFAESIRTERIALGVIFSAAAMALRRAHIRPVAPATTPRQNQNNRFIMAMPFPEMPYSPSAR